ERSSSTTAIGALCTESPAPLASIITAKKNDHSISTSMTGSPRMLLISLPISQKILRRLRILTFLLAQQQDGDAREHRPEQRQPPQRAGKIGKGQRLGVTPDRGHHIPCRRPKAADHPRRPFER